MGSDLAKPIVESHSSIKEPHSATKEPHSSIKDLLECPVCMTFMCPPIHQCSNGHTICFTCKDGVKNICPLCRERLENIRCIALDKLAEMLDVPCKFHELGCQGNFSYEKRLMHEQICSFRPYNCPYGCNKCSVTGNIKFLVAHLKESHFGTVFDGSTFERICYLVDPSSNFKQDNVILGFSIINCFSHQFYLHFRAFNIGNATFYNVLLLFMGDGNEAKTFTYSLEVDKEGRKMTWQGIPRTIRDSVENVEDSLDGLIIPKNLFSFYSVDKLGSPLRVAGRIWRKEIS